VRDGTCEGVSLLRGGEVKHDIIKKTGLEALGAMSGWSGAGELHCKKWNCGRRRICVRAGQSRTKRTITRSSVKRKGNRFKERRRGRKKKRGLPDIERDVPGQAKDHIG